MRTPEDPASLGIEMAPGERAIWTGRPTPLGHLRRAMPMVGLQAAGLLVFVVFVLVLSPGSGLEPLVTVVIPLMAAVIVMGILVGLLGALRTRYALSDARLYVREGLLVRRTYAFRPSALPPLRLFASIGDAASIGYRLDRETATKAPPVSPLARVILLDGIPEASDVLRRLDALRTEALEASAAERVGAVPKPVVGSAGSPLAGMRGMTIFIGAFFTGLALLMLVTLVWSGGLVVAWPFAAGATAFLAVGLGIVGYQVRAIRRERRILASGHRVIGTVTGIARGNAEVNDQPTYEIRYRYDVLGHPYEGRIGGLTYAAAHRVGIGDAINVAVDPVAASSSIPLLEA